MPPAPKHTRRRFQFEKGRLPFASAWIAASVGFFVGWWNLESDHGSKAGLLFLGSWLTGCIGVGTLFGRPKAGFAVGLILFAIQTAIFMALWYGGLSVE
jgi:hypothetical protein